MRIAQQMYNISADMTHSKFIVRTQTVFLCFIFTLLVSVAHSAPTADSRQRFIQLKLTAADNHHKTAPMGEHSPRLGQTEGTIAATVNVLTCEMRRHQEILTEPEDRAETWKTLSWSGLKAASRSIWSWMSREPIQLAKQIIATAVESAKKFSLWLFTSFRKITKTIGRGIKVGVGHVRKMSGYELAKFGLDSLREVIETVGTLKILLSFVF